jgi:CDP-glycerol glycerophosphotransferase
MNFNIQTFYAEHYESSVINTNLVLYEVRDGDSITDSPYALFLHLARNEEYHNYKHVWVLKDINSKMRNNIPDDIFEKVIFVERDTQEYVDYMLTAKYLITNATFQSWFSKKENQIYINTWHGTPLKHMGFDIPGNPVHSQNVVRNLLMTDFLLTPNAHTSRVFSESYKLKGLYTGEIIESGYPRIDFLYNTNKNSLIDSLLDDGVAFNPKLPTILYMPTWRGKSITNPTNNIKQIIAEINKIKEYFTDQYNVLLKVHPYIFHATQNEENIRTLLIDDRYDANQVLALTDILITDFSSVFFDYLVTDKPILFYIWDADLYEDERGMYFEMDKLPGPQLFAIDDVIETIENIDLVQEKFSEKYKLLKKEIVPYDDGKVSERIIGKIFSKKDKDNVKILQVNNSKPKLLFCPGGLLNNGITSSFINLLKNIDYSQYDVTVFMPTPDSDMLKNVNKLPKTIRLLFKPGAPIYTEKEKMENENVPDMEPILGYERESRRLFSGINYDVAIDFSGYSHYWAKFLAYSTAKRKIIYQHNDLNAEVDKEINGRKPHHKNLPKLFSIYHKFDKVVSVSNELMLVNYSNLSDYMTKEQCAYARNIIDIKRVIGVEHAESVENKLKIHLIDKEFILPKGSYRFYKNTSDIFNGKSETFLITDKSARGYSIARLTFEKSFYYKLIINNIYSGWVKAIDLTLFPLSIEYIDQKKVNRIASFKKRSKGFLVYSNLETEKARTFARYLKNRYLTIVKEVNTNKGHFSFVKLDGEKIGWIRSKALGNVHNISKYSPLQLYFTLKNLYRGKLKVTDQLNFKLMKLILKNEMIQIHSEPLGVTGSYIKSVYYPKEFNIYSTNKIAEVDGQTWYLLSENKMDLGWISESSILKKIVVEKIDFSERDELLMNFINKSISESSHNYVTMGRLSPEKNHIELIKAFNTVLKKFPDANLFIFGDGPLKDSILNMVNEYQISNQVHLLGHIENPFKFLKLMDVFVLPSLYEGQPMVLLEAMTLGIKIVASGIVQNKAVLENNRYGLLAEGTNNEELSIAMKNIFDEQVDFECFDYESYNKQALDEFLQNIKPK